MNPDHKIPFVDLPGQCNAICDEVLPAIEAVIRKANFILGDEVQRFEEDYARFCDADHCVAVASGTDALHLALRALGVGPGDEVITAANSFAATGFAIRYTGATPVFVDISETDHNIDVDLLEQAVSPRTKAIIPVHLYGQPADMDAVKAFADKHSLAIVEDTCQAHGASYKGQRTGSLGNAGCFSFYPGKNLGAFGDGGAITTNDAELAERLHLLRNYGQPTKNVHTHLGYNSRLDTMQAAVLRVKLNYLDRWTEGRRQVAEWYREFLSTEVVKLPQERDDFRHVYHLFVVRHPRRDELLEFLKQRNIFAGIHYPTPLPHLPALAESRCVPDGVPVATAVSHEILSLPMYPELTKEQVQLIADAVNCFADSQVTV